MKSPNRTFYLAFSAILLALLIICAQIVLPLPMIPLTLQPLGVGMIGTLLPLPWAGATILAYLALGALGLPVFAGAHGGIAAFLTPSGGYLPSFLVYAVLAALFLRNRQKNLDQYLCSQRLCRDDLFSAWFIMAMLTIHCWHERQSCLNCRDLTVCFTSYWRNCRLYYHCYGFTQSHG